MEPIRVLIADDHTLFRNGLTSLLKSVDEVEVVGETATGRQTIEVAAQLQPDVILMDIQMPGDNGIEATRKIVRDSPHVGIIMLTMFDDDESVFAAMRAGARGYILKGVDQSALLRAIHAVAHGESLFSPEIAQRMMHFFSDLKPVEPADLFPELTGREREILTLIAQGAVNTDIASELVISVKTVRNHVSNILSKLQVADRTQATLRAREAGLGLRPDTQ